MKTSSSEDTTATIPIVADEVVIRIAQVVSETLVETTVPVGNIHINNNNNSNNDNNNASCIPHPPQQQQSVPSNSNDEIVTKQQHPTDVVGVVVTTGNTESVGTIIPSTTTAGNSTNTATATTTGSGSGRIRNNDDITCFSTTTSTTNIDSNGNFYTDKEHSSTQLLLSNKDNDATLPPIIAAVVEPPDHPTSPIIKQSPPPAPPPPQQQPLSNWHYLQPISSSEPNTALVYVHQPIHVVPTTTTTASTVNVIPSESHLQPQPLKSDRMTRRPTLLRYSIIGPPTTKSFITQPSPQPSVLQKWFLDVVMDDTTTKSHNNNNTSKKLRHSGTTTETVTQNHTTPTPPTITTVLTTSIEKIPNISSIQKCTNRFLQQIEFTIQQREEQQFLYRMTWYAILEECQSTWYHTTMSTTTSITTSSATVNSNTGNTTLNGTNTAGSHNNISESTTTTTSSSSIRSPFSYYTEAPSTTTTSTNVATTISNSYDQLYNHDLILLPSSVSFTPANLMQRIKQGCFLAYQELLHHDTGYYYHSSNTQQQQQPPSNSGVSSLALLSNTTITDLPRRSSTRIVINQTANATAVNNELKSNPHVVISSSQTTTTTTTALSSSSSSSSSVLLQAKYGGRVALSLLQQYSLSSSGGASAASTKESRRRSAPNPTTTVNTKVGGTLDDDKDMNDELASKDDDEEYEVEPDPTEEDEDENIEATKDNVKKDDNDDDEAWMGRMNPYLVPDRYALLEWIGKKAARTWSTTDLQSIFATTSMVYYDPKKKRKKGKTPQQQRLPTGSSKSRNFGFDISSTDTDPYMICQLLYEQSLDNQHSTFHSLPFMMSSTLSKHDKILALMNLLFPNDSDDNSHDRTKIILTLSGGNIEDIDETIDEWDLSYFSRTQFTVRLMINESIQNEILYHVEQQAFQQQEALKEQRQFEIYRYKSIQGGFCKWGVSWLQVANEYVTATLNNAKTATVVSSTMTDDQDLILAQTLAAQLEAEEGSAGESSGRRKTRRVGESSGVFYGNQSNLSQKQIMDALLRLLSSSKQPYQTLVGLLQALPDDSTDPMKRMRTVIGKLLFKRNQLSRMEVDTLDTDSDTWNMVQSRMLFQLPKSSADTVEEDTEKETPVPVVSDNQQLQKEAVSERIGMEPTSLAISEIESVKNDSDTRVTELMDYVYSLQETELQLRRLVVQHLSEVPIAIIATAGDDRIGSMESMDDVDFEDPSIPIPWETEGNPYLSQRIFRPVAKEQEIGESTKCYWFTVTGFVPSVVLPPSNSTDQVDKPYIGRAREPISVERRIRFRAVPSDTTQQHLIALPLILTEAQIRAGMKAAEIQASKQQSGAGLSDHPLPSMSTPKICLVPIQTTDGRNTTVATIDGFVVGHNRCMKNGTIENKILVLPKVETSNLPAFWTTLMVPSASNGLGGITCTINSVQYTVQQLDFHQSSKAFHACMAIVRYLERHPKSIPFLQPVDPIALGIPDYLNVIKHPMDISTLLKKLEQGDYAHIPLNFMKAQDSVVRMLNGSFRKDVELIFDNAMLFNSPNDWIHQAASLIKKAVVKKMEQMSTSSDVSSIGRQRKQNSLYIDYDSDVDMYTYESDYDDNNNYSRKRNKGRNSSNTNKNANGSKHSRAPINEDAATRAVERGVRIQKMLNDTFGVRGPLSSLPIQSNASEFSLPVEWSCQYKEKVAPTNEAVVVDTNVTLTTTSVPTSIITTELDELRSLHRLTEENEQSGVRRSTRAAVEQQQEQKAASACSPGLDIVYTCPYKISPLGNGSNTNSNNQQSPSNRLQVETICEMRHETYFSKLFQSFGKNLRTQSSLDKDTASDAGETITTLLGEYTDGSFPPYLGRVVPMIPLLKERESSEVQPNVLWEIREPYVVPALRWIIRGLLYTNHLVQISDSGSAGNPLRESILQQNENVLLFPNHIYYIDDSTEPFDVLDVKELARRKKQKTAKSNDDGDSDDEIEMSEYEKARAERMARNKDRLVALGLA